MSSVPGCKRRVVQRHLGRRDRFEAGQGGDLLPGYGGDMDMPMGDGSVMPNSDVCTVKRSGRCAEEGEDWIDGLCYSYGSA